MQVSLIKNNFFFTFQKEKDTVISILYFQWYIVNQYCKKIAKVKSLSLDYLKRIIDIRIYYTNTIKK